MRAEYDVDSFPPIPEPTEPPKLFSTRRAVTAVTKSAKLAFLGYDPKLADAGGHALFERLRARLEARRGIETAHEVADDVALTLFAVSGGESGQGVDAALALMLGRGVRHAVEVAARLADVAVKSVARFQTFEVDGKSVNVRRAWAFHTGGGASANVSTFLLSLGPHVRACPPDERAELRAIVDARFASMPPTYRRALAWTFDDAAFAEASVRDALESDRADAHPTIVTRLRDADVGTAFVERFAEVLRREVHGWSMRALAERQPAEVAEAWLLRLLEGASERDARPVLQRLATIRSARVAARLGEALASPHAIEIATAYFERNRELATTHLPELARRRGKKWDPARALLARFEAHAHERALADESAWPAVLRQAPWRSPRPPIAELELTPIEVEETIRVHLAEPLQYEPGREAKAEAEYASKGPKQASRYVFKDLPPARVRELLLRDGHEMRLQREDLLEVAARFEDLASICITIALHWPKRHVAFFGAVRSVRAVHALMALADDPEIEREAMPAFLREAATVALALLPLAFAPGSSVDAWRRHRAERMLRILRERGYELEVRHAAARYGADAVAAVDALYRCDPALFFPPPNTPSAGAFEAPPSLPPLELRGSGEAIGPEGVARVIEMLRFAGRDEYAGLVALREAVTPESADAFAWALFVAWELGGMRGGEWPLFAIGHLGGETCARGLDQRLRDWPTNGGGVSRMRSALEALARNGTPEALLRLRNAGQRSRYADTQDLVDALLGAVATRRGLTLDELQDRLVPTLGLEQGWPSFDFGSQRFELRVGEDLEASLVDASGAHVAKLPKPRKADDPKLAAAAKERLVGLQRDLAEVVEGQRRHFQRALREQRAWAREDFAWLTNHPLLGRMVRGLVWASGARLLRVDEAGALTSSHDEAVEVERGASIRLAHPAIDDATELDRMRQLLLDYRILQPFPQLGREVYRLDAKERSATRLDRLRGRERAAAPLRRLLEGGAWRSPDESSRVLVIDVGTGTVEAAVEPGLSSWSGSGPRRLGLLCAFDRAGSPMAFGGIDVVRMSEVLRDLIGGAG